MSSRRGMGRQATAKALQGRQAEGLFAFMNGAPEAIERDKQFYALFGEWARKGRDPKSPLVARLKARWAEVMANAKDEDNGQRSIPKLGRARGRVVAASPR